MTDRLEGIRLRVRCQRFHCAGLRVQGDQRRRVPAAAVAQVQVSAGRIEVERTGRHVVLGADRHERLPLPGPGSRQDLRATIRWDHHGEPGGEVVVSQDLTGSHVILDNDPRLSRQDVDPVQIVILRIPPVDRDQHLVGEPVRQAVRDCLDAVVRREVARPAGIDLDGVDVPVLVAVPVLTVEEVARMVAPQVVPDSPAPVAGDRLRIPDRVQRCHPDVEHAVHRRQVGDSRAVVLSVTAVRSGFPNSVFRGISSTTWSFIHDATVDSGRLKHVTAASVCLPSSTQFTAILLHRGSRCYGRPWKRRVRIRRKPPSSRRTTWRPELRRPRGALAYHPRRPAAERLRRGDS